METLCHPCDLFVGYGAAGVMKAPENKNVEWLSSHCWGCSRSREEINIENSKESIIGVHNAR